jgi:hypothetical protein
MVAKYCVLQEVKGGIRLGRCLCLNNQLMKHDPESDAVQHCPPVLFAAHSLKPKESVVLRQRLGLDGKRERSLEEIGRNLNLSREMV